MCPCSNGSLRCLFLLGTAVFCLVWTAPSTRAVASTVDDEKCVWPECVPRCLPCSSKQVDTCLLSYVSKRLFACKKRLGPTECFLGKCLCKDGYCADKKTRRCVPKVCFPGSSPPEFQPNWWVRFYALMGGGGRFPAPEELHQGGGYAEYILVVGILPAMILNFGLVMSVVTCFCLCRDSTEADGSETANPAHKHAGILGEGSGPVRDVYLRFPMRHRNSISASAQDDGHQYDATMADVATGLISGRRRCYSEVAAPQRPCVLPMLVSAVVIVIFTGLGIVTRQMTHRRSERIVHDQLDRAEHDSVIVAEQSAVVASTARRIKDDLDHMSYMCKEFLHIDDVDEYVFDYVAMIENYDATVQPLPTQIQLARKFVLQNSYMTIWIPQVPLFLMLVICMAIVVEAIATACYGNSQIGQCVHLGLKWSSVAFVTIILAVSLATSVIYLVGILLSQFCMDVDQNVLDNIVYAAGPNYTDVHNISRFYLSGAVHNPILGYAEMAEAYINHIEETYHRENIAFQWLENACPELADINVTRTASDTRRVLDNTKLLLSGENVWPYYDSIVREGACDSVVESIGWISSLLFIMGLVFFPLCAMLTHRFLVQWAEWQAWIDRGELQEKPKNKLEWRSALAGKRGRTADLHARTSPSSSPRALERRSFSY